MQPGSPYAMQPPPSPPRGQVIYTKHYTTARMGGVVLACICVGLALLPIVWGYGFDPTSVPSLIIGVVVLILCFRPTIVLTTTTLSIRGAFSTRVVPLPSISDIYVRRSPPMSGRFRWQYHVHVLSQDGWHGDTTMFEGRRSSYWFVGQVVWAVRHYNPAFVPSGE